MQPGGWSGPALSGRLHWATPEQSLPGNQAATKSWEHGAPTATAHFSTAIDLAGKCKHLQQAEG